MLRFHLMTVPEAAIALNLPKQRVYELLRLGLLPGVRFGRQLRIERTALQAWIAAGGRGLPASKEHGSE
jgi:excisionase family DNA binding protein